MKANSGVSFETKVWEGDYRVVLGTSRLDRMIARNSYDFASRRVYINNCDNYLKVIRLCRRKVSEGVIDDFVVVEDHAGDALKFFGLTRQELGIGYVYSIAELVGIYLAEERYLLHFSGDSLLEEEFDWIPSALSLLSCRDEVKVVNLVWNSQYEMLRGLRGLQDDDYFFGQGFSDQMYLIPVADYRQQIYTETHLESARYPAYGGELFEKRVDSWQRNHGYIRAVWKHGSYRHASIRPTVAGRMVGQLKELEVLGYPLAPLLTRGNVLRKGLMGRFPGDKRGWGDVG